MTVKTAEYELSFIINRTMHSYLTESYPTTKEETIQQYYATADTTVHIMPTNVNTFMGEHIVAYSNTPIPQHLRLDGAETIPDPNKCAIRFRRTTSEAGESAYILELKANGYEEHPFFINKSAWQQVEKANMPGLEKTREYVKWKDHTLHLDTIVDPSTHRTLYRLEIEFNTKKEMEAFQPPEYFGTQVSGPKHSNKAYTSYIADGTFGAYINQHTLPV